MFLEGSGVMIEKVLIANRGEIAARIIRACKSLNIKTVAIYSEADEQAQYVSMADESYLLGPSPVTESYLNTKKILSIAKEANVDAIHPGYGFLSENSEFVYKCEQAGLNFIGPASNVIKQMGDKIAARHAMKEAGIPIIPGSEDEVATAEEAIEIAHKIGYPIMIKAAAGGGGIGMEVVNSDNQLKTAFNNNSTRARNFFGDGSMFLEKKIDHARHIEVQILADHHGNVVHLFERECSIQRRNQKVLEEAPSTFISSETRRKMGDAAVHAAKALNYTNAGTIEFLVDDKENFYFLEMNTRIQVEHPVTEEVTGIDLVQEQIKIANHHPLSIQQSDIHVKGHAIEVRIYAEDPKTFFPSPGKITAFNMPSGERIRNEVSVENNDQVTHYYDPMIGKLIVTGPTRNEAIKELANALEQYKIVGIKTNIPLLSYIVNHDQFKSGNTTTDFIEKY